MKKKLKIGEKLALILIVFTLVVTVFLTASYYLQTESALRERVFLQLSSIKQLKKVKTLNELEDQLEVYEQLRKDSLFKLPVHFIHVQRDSVLPDKIRSYEIPEGLQVFESASVLDVTGQNAAAGITLVFISRTNDQYLTALVRMPEVQEILLERTGLGTSGESYLVNSDRQLITKSRFDSVNWENIEVKTRGVNQAFRDYAGTDVFMDYRNIRVMGAYEKINFRGLEWVLLSEIDFDEAMAPLYELRRNLFYSFILILIFILIVSYYLSRHIVKPVIIMEHRLIKLSQGILENEGTPVANDDEIGKMFDALNKLIEALDRTVLFAREIGSGNFEAHYTLLSDEDQLGEALLQMKYRLQEYQTNEARLMRENQLSFIEGEENERSRLSKEMHDGIGPFLTTLKMQMQAADIEPNLKKKLLDQMDQTIDEVRRISNNLMPSVLTDFGVGEAINNLVQSFATSNSIKIKYKNDTCQDSKVGKVVQTALYRIAQEAISNAMRHSQCTELKISISEFDDHMGLFISDNGNGFFCEQPHAGNGIRNMKERVKLVNGTMDIASNSTGTTIEIEIPLS